MSYGVALEVWGDYALFTRPEMSVERVTYDVITPSAARGLVESIYWLPGLRVVIDRIHVLNPIEYTSVRRNQLKDNALASSMKTAITNSVKSEKIVLPSINRAESIQQRASLILTNVRYVLEFHFEMTQKAASGDNPGKFADIFRRRIAKGQYYSQPYFGTREFAANFRPWPAGEKIHGYYSDVQPGERDLGFMLFDMDYSDRENITPMFFRARMIDGTIDVVGSEVYR